MHYKNWKKIGLKEDEPVYIHTKTNYERCNMETLKAKILDFLEIFVPFDIEHKLGTPIHSPSLKAGVSLGES